MEDNLDKFQDMTDKMKEEIGDKLGGTSAEVN